MDRLARPFQLLSLLADPSKFFSIKKETKKKSNDIIELCGLLCIYWKLKYAKKGAQNAVQYASVKLLCFQGEATKFLFY